jgi:hypothetical protein
MMMIVDILLLLKAEAYTKNLYCEDLFKDLGIIINILSKLKKLILFTYSRECKRSFNYASRDSLLDGSLRG